MNFSDLSCHLRSHRLDDNTLPNLISVYGHLLENGTSGLAQAFPNGMLICIEDVASDSEVIRCHIDQTLSPPIFNF